MTRLHPVFERALVPFAPAPKTTRATPTRVDVLVEDVRYRARRHGFCIDNRQRAYELAQESAATLGLEPTAQELAQVVERLF